MKKKRKVAKSTIPTRGSNRRAPRDVEMHFYQLERFVNLGDDPSAWKEFCEVYPEFFPVRFCTIDYTDEDDESGIEFASYQPEFYNLFRTFRDMLRGVWKSNSETKLAILLGIDTIAWQIIARRKEASQEERFFGGPQIQLEEAMSKISSQFKSGPSNQFYPKSLVPDLRTGTFRYDPDTDFRRAVYALFRQMWRAKICPRCAKYFVGDKPPQTYCSSKCYGEAKKERDLQLWRSVGSERRKERTSHKGKTRTLAVQKPGRR